MDDYEPDPVQAALDTAKGPDAPDALVPGADQIPGLGAGEAAGMIPPRRSAMPAIEQAAYGATEPVRYVKDYMDEAARTGRLRPSGDVAEQWGAPMAVNMVQTGSPFAQAGGAGISGGRLGLGADHWALAKAQQAEEMGLKPPAIYRQTGWYKKPTDDMWRFWIDDVPARLKTADHEVPTVQGMGGFMKTDFSRITKMGDIIDHPELFKNYPHLENMPINWDRGMPRGDASFNPRTNRNPTGSISLHPDDYLSMRHKPGDAQADFKGRVIHELQHAVQEHEGFINGAGPSAMIQEALARASPDFQKAYHALPADEQRAMAYRLYRKQAGENEAWMADTFARQGINPEAIRGRAHPPSRWEQTPLEEQIMYSPVRRRPPGTLPPVVASGGAIGDDAIRSALFEARPKGYDDGGDVEDQPYAPDNPQFAPREAPMPASWSGRFEQAGPPMPADRMPEHRVDAFGHALASRDTLADMMEFRNTGDFPMAKAPNMEIDPNMRTDKGSWAYYPDNMDKGERYRSMTRNSMPKMEDLEPFLRGSYKPPIRVLQPWEGRVDRPMALMAPLPPRRPPEFRAYGGAVDDALDLARGYQEGGDVDDKAVIPGVDEIPSVAPADTIGMIPVGSEPHLEKVIKYPNEAAKGVIEGLSSPDPDYRAKTGFLTALGATSAPGLVGGKLAIGPGEEALTAGAFRRSGRGKGPPVGGGGGGELPPTGAGPDPVEAALDVAKTGRREAITATSLRRMPLDEAINVARSEKHIIPSPKGEGYVGAPEWVKTPEDLAKMRADFDAQVAEGAAGGDWYKRAQEGAKTVAGEDPARQSLHARENALFSAQATPDTNLGFTLQAHNAWERGVPEELVHTGQQARTYNEARATGQPIKLAKKTGVFGEHLDPTMEDPTTGTNDIWHARSFGYTNKGKPWDKALTAQQHAFMDAETVLAVDRANQQKLLGKDNWTAGEVQAAPWVAMKAKDLMRRFPKRFPDMDSAMAEATKTYTDYYPKFAASATYENVPGIDTGHLPGLVAGSDAERAAFSMDPRRSWTGNTGEDILYRAAGYNQLPTEGAIGVFQSGPGRPIETNMANVGRPLLAQQQGPMGREVTPGDMALMRAVEAFRGYSSAQNAVASSKFIPEAMGAKAGASGSVHIPTTSNTPESVMQLKALGEQHGLPDVLDLGPQGSILTRFGETPPSGKETGKALKSGLASGIQELTGQTPSRGRLQSNFDDFADAWKAGEGSREVTKKLFEIMHDPQVPSLINKLDADPLVRNAIGQRMQADIEYARKNGLPVRKDVLLAQKILSTRGEAGGINGLWQAYLKNASLPAGAGLAYLLQNAKETDAQWR